MKNTAGTIRIPRNRPIQKLLNRPSFPPPTGREAGDFFRSLPVVTPLALVRGLYHGACSFRPRVVRPVGRSSLDELRFACGLMDGHPLPAHKPSGGLVSGSTVICGQISVFACDNSTPPCSLES